MQIFLGADHGGFERKNQIKAWLLQKGHQVDDMGAKALDPKDDYPVFAEKVAVKVQQNPQSVGILFCRSGAGMAIAANKIKGIRAAETWDATSAAHAKEHNHANLITLAADWQSLKESQEIIDAFLQAKPNKAERHLRRINLIKQIES